MSVNSAFQGSDTKLGQVGGNTTRFLMVVLRICHSENRCGYGAMFLQRPGAGRSYADAANRSLERLREERVAREGGYRVLLPFGVNQRYDLVIDRGKRFLRDYRGDADLFSATVPRRTGSMLLTSKRLLPLRPSSEWIQRPTTRSAGFVGRLSMNCPPSSTGRALHL